ncbi:hypothetical protein [Trinickia fusca]|uniref:Uncharacterized protein n=1 Tax=Trinickia fusca TaxID=2419777 RepID=A0A494X7M4_9BURK|nr:hypothetical protein [Trinickia fusca]RKP46460.1 hypothetical protein D7S89_17705 [Trinickia fusca]
MSKPMGDFDLNETLIFACGLMLGIGTATLGKWGWRQAVWRLLMPLAFAVTAYAATTLWGPPYLGLIVLFVSVAAGAGYLVGLLVVAGIRRVVSRS